MPDFFDHPVWLVLVGLAVVVAIIWWRRRKRPLPPLADNAPRLTRKMARHYAQSSLSDNEIALFRSTMDQAVVEIKAIEALLPEIPTIAARLETMQLDEILHAYFKAIVAAPERLGEAGHFIYQQLPELRSLTEQYAKINRHTVKSEDTYLVLNEAEVAIVALSERITADYTAFIKDDIETMQATIAQTKQDLQH